MSAFQFLLLSLAVWRAACIISHEDGPACLCMRFRDALMTRWPGPGGAGELVSCPFCLSVWIGGLATVSWCIWPEVTCLVTLPLALSAIVVLLERLLPDDDSPEDQPPSSSSLVD